MSLSHMFSFRAAGASREPWNAPFTFQIPASCRCLLVKLYDGTCDYRHLLAVSAPFYPGEAQL